MEGDELHMKKSVLVVLGGCVLALAIGCGKPPSSGGPPGEFPVRAVVALVEARSLEEPVRLVGSLRARQSIDVASELNGVVEALLFEEGQAVAAGAPLVRLRDDKLRARVQEAEARLTLAAANFERGADLRRKETISVSDHDRLRAEFDAATAMRDLARAELEDAEIAAPFDAVTGARLISVGAFVRAGEPITSLVQVHPLEATFNVPERYVRLLAAGQQVALRNTAYPDETFTGTVFFIAPRVDEATRTVLVKAEVPNQDQRLKPGMFINLDLVLRIKPDALMIPEQAVQVEGERARVYLMNDEGKAELREVETGVRQPGVIEVTAGLAAGDRVVIEGYQKMGPGAKIIVAPGSAAYGVEPTAAWGGEVPDVAEPEPVESAPVEAVESSESAS
jgi:membrane fusion protein, multidrug efflux system